MLKVGQKRPEWKTVQGLILEYSSSGGFTLYYNQPNLTQKEIKQFKANEPFQIAFKEFDDVGIFCFKFGDGSIMDAPFSPNLYTPRPTFAPIPQTNGYVLTVLIIEHTTGELKDMRVIGLGNEFSNIVRNFCLRSLEKNISKTQYVEAIDSIYSTYPTSEDILIEADVVWSIS